MLRNDRDDASGPDTPLKIAHRGWHREHVENTLEAFRAAYAAGCDMVEFDVQLSRDGVPVIFHDDDCRRLAGRSENVRDLDWRDLQALSLRADRKKSFSPVIYRIPSLAQFLAEFGKRPFYLELKVPEAKADDADYIHALGEKSAERVRTAGAHPGTFLASFHGGILRHLARRKSYPLLAGIFESYDRFREVHAGADPETAAAIRYYSVSWGVYRKYVKENPGPGAKGNPRDTDIMIWNINGTGDFEFAARRGAAAIVTDDVETLLRMDGGHRTREVQAGPVKPGPDP